MDLKSALQGAAAGAGLTLLAMLGWQGFAVLNGSAVVQAMMQVCVERALTTPEAVANLQATTSMFDRRTQVRDAG